MHPAPPEQLLIHTSDPDEACARLSNIYCEHRLSVTPGSGPFAARQTAGSIPGLRLFELGFGGADTEIDSQPFDDFVLVSRPLRGRFSVVSSDAGGVRVSSDALVMDPYASYRLGWHEGCAVWNMAFDRERFEAVAAELRGYETPRRLTFALGPSGSPTQREAWAGVSRFLYEQVGPGSAVRLAPLARAQLVRLAIATLLDAYPNSSHADEPAGGTSPGLPALRRAIAFIESRAEDPIGLREIAEAARLSPRGLQLAFRRFEDTTPLAFLRETRLRRAHVELAGANPATTTVTEVASRWGFVHLGRFAVEHRRVFGLTPSEVLRGA
ncbi:hypothetical protein GCM10022198_16470 [Klugiella xanthotipulae]|uniref:AraC-like DNA-binding protein n=1 Tax=Klugiella xanthotipulae TaxID=244735 RepID=A0A543HH91_9MICO|nr:AraC family transcriptional regulator [Klugiella xanthotipulae]TQM57683.1 AraC-like DNA-binding protein [Klugiella xanthotipulae]